MARLTIYASLAAAAAGAALAWSFQAARLGAELADERLQASQYREQVADERTAAGRRVLAGLQAAADRARRERDGLRKQLSDAEQRLADASPAALIEYARTLGKVFGQCSQRYTELAIRADGHAADAATCRAAWPVIPQPKENQ